MEDRGPCCKQGTCLQKYGMESKLCFVHVFGTQKLLSCCIYVSIAVVLKVDPNVERAKNCQR